MAEVAIVNYVKLSTFSSSTIEDGTTARDIVEKMIARDPSLRPTVQSVRKHPAFWSNEKTLKFLEVIDRPSWFDWFVWFDWFDWFVWFVWFVSLKTEIIISQDITDHSDVLFVVRVEY